MNKRIATAVVMMMVFIVSSVSISYADTTIAMDEKDNLKVSDMNVETSTVIDEKDQTEVSDTGADTSKDMDKKVLADVSKAKDADKKVLHIVSKANTDTSIAVDKKNFHDKNFRKYIREKFDDDSDGYLSEEEINNVKVINVRFMGIESVKGVELFPELVMLDCSGNYIRNLNITKNSKLKHLYCTDNYIDSLDVSCNPSLAFLYAENNNIQYIDYSGTKLDPDNGRFFYLATGTVLPVHRNFDYTTIPGLDFLLTSGDVYYGCESMTLDPDSKTISIDDDKETGYLNIIYEDGSYDTFLFLNSDVTVSAKAEGKAGTKGRAGDSKTVKPDTSPATGDGIVFYAVVLLLMIISAVAAVKIKRTR